MNRFIVTGQGFLKKSFFNKETRKIEYIFTKHVRDALEVNNGTTLLENIKKEFGPAFIYRPWAEEPLRDVYQVILERDEHYYSNKPKINYKIYVVEQVKMVHETDVDFLQNRKLKRDKYFTFDEATVECIRMNSEMLNELIAKINNC